MSPWSTTPAFTQSAGRSAGDALSLERRLPLIMTVLFAGGLAALLGFTYATLTRREESFARDRLLNAARAVAATAEVSLQQRRAVLRQAASDSAVRRALERARLGTPDDATLSAARASLTSILVARDSSAVALLAADGRPLTRAGPPATVPGDLPSPEELRALADDSVHIGRLHRAGERVGFRAIAPVYVGGERMGYVAQLRTVGGLRNAVSSLRGLVGEQVTLYVRNRDGSVWVAAPGQPARAPRRADTTDHGVIITRDDGARSFAEEAWIDGTPWSAVMETPTSAVLARPREAVAWLAVLSLLLTVAGGIVAWVVSRRITRPLTELTAAAEAVAEGTYEHPVVAGHDEIGRLATSFDEMARQVDAARRELERRAEDAQRARSEAERANRAKSDFLAMMSHELRTPLNAIGGYTELLRMEIHGPITDAQRDALVRISRSQAHLLTLINDVLNFARVDAGQVQFEIRDVPVQETLASLEALIAPQVRTRGIRFEVQPCDPALTARADRDKLGQVVLNLLGNAIKFTPEGGTVQLTCEADAEHVRVHVRDTGSGIAPERLDEIFEPFVQAHRALNRPSEGVGLGLAISRDLARGMGGEITVSSVLGLGSTFSLTLQRGPDRVALGEPGRTSRDTPESAPVA